LNLSKWVLEDRELAIIYYILHSTKKIINYKIKSVTTKAVFKK